MKMHHGAREDIATQVFLSPTYGERTFEGMIADICREVRENPEARFRVCVGSDSENIGGIVKLVTAVVVWKVARGARAYRAVTHSFLSPKMDRTSAMRQRILQEVLLTGTLAQELRTSLREGLGEEILERLEVHADVGPNGGTSVMMREVIGMLRGYGFSEEQIKVKPEAYAAASVADHYI